MDSKIWTEVGKISESEYDGDVSATIEALCKTAFRSRGLNLS